MNLRINTSDSLMTDSGVFRVEQSSGHRSLMMHDTSEILDSTELFGAIPTEIITNSPVATPEPRIITANSVSSQPFTPNGFWRQWFIVTGLDFSMTTLIKRQLWNFYRQPKATTLTGAARHHQCRRKFSPYQFHQWWSLEWMCKKHLRT